MVKSPSNRIGPLLKTVTFVAISCMVTEGGMRGCKVLRGPETDRTVGRKVGGLPHHGRRGGVAWIVRAAAESSRARDSVRIWNGRFEFRLNIYQKACFLLPPMNCLDWLHRAGRWLRPLRSRGTLRKSCLRRDENAQKRISSRATGHRSIVAALPLKDALVMACSGPVVSRA